MRGLRDLQESESVRKRDKMRVAGPNGRGLRGEQSERSLVGVVEGEGHGERAAVRSLPAVHVGAASVAEVVAGAGVGVVSPQPDEVVTAVGPAAEACVWVLVRLGAVQGVRHACEEQPVAVQPAPSAAGGVVDVDEGAAAHAHAVAVVIDERAVGGVEEERVGHLVLHVADHGALVRQAVDVERASRLEIDEGARVHIARHVEAISLVKAHYNPVVVVPSDLGRELLEPPCRVAECPLSDRHCAGWGVVGDKLLVSLGQQRELHADGG